MTSAPRNPIITVKAEGANVKISYDFYPGESRRLLSSSDLRELFKVSHNVLYVWRKKGMPYVESAGRPLYSLLDVMRWLEGQNVYAGVFGEYRNSDEIKLKWR